METSRARYRKIVTPACALRASNDNFGSHVSSGQSLFPEDAVARIFKPSRSVMTSGTSETKEWRLVFDRRSAPFIDPLMGFTGGIDTLMQVELDFPTLESVIRYAERQNLTYVVHGRATKPARRIRQPLVQRPKPSSQSFSATMLERLGLSALQGSYDQALDDAANRNDPVGPENWSSPMDVVTDKTLSRQAKRSILMDWAWTEYLIDQATNEGMPENKRPSRLSEVEEALLSLERDAEYAESRISSDRNVA